MPAILKGVNERLEQGPLTGSYARDIIVYIYDGKMHPVDSNEMAFKIAGRMAFSAAFKNAGPKIMEPIYDLDVRMPADLMGAVMTDLQGRRAIVMGMDSDHNYQTIHAKVPLAEMDRYSTSLSSLTSGRGTFTMKYAEYQQVPTDVQNRLLKEYEERGFLYLCKHEKVFLYRYSIAVTLCSLPHTHTRGATYGGRCRETGRHLARQHR